MIGRFESSYSASVAYERVVRTSADQTEASTDTSPVRGAPELVVMRYSDLPGLSDQPDKFPVG